ncbi:MAG: double-strand break repair protein AddB [Parvularculaceae bacterium]
MSSDAPPTPAFDPFATSPPRLFSIDAGRPFLDDLAAGLVGALGGDPFAMADALVLVPTRRAARALDDAFVDAAPAGVALLPRVRTLGDLDEDAGSDLVAVAGGAAALDDALEAPPPVNNMTRVATRAGLVAAKAAAEGATGATAHWPAALAAARELAALLDSFYTEEVPFGGLAALAPDAFADHWGRSLAFLKIATASWPAHLAEIGRDDPTRRRARAIEALRRRFEAAPPEAPVIVAGSTGSAPAVRRLLRTVAGLPRGLVVLPGLDREADEKAWRGVDDPHPQAGLKLLLSEFGVAHTDVSSWPAGGEERPMRARRRLLSLALRPAAATDDWRAEAARAKETDPDFQDACADFTLLEMANEDAEAAAIAIRLRETLATPGRTAMLVTPDRKLARRVALKMRRWGVTVDDSAGAPFADTRCGVFLRLVAQWLAAPADAVALLALARHPLAGFGLSPTVRQRSVDALDEGLRGLSPTAGEGVAAVERRLARDERLLDAARPVLQAVARVVGEGLRGDVAAMLDAHLAAAEILAADGDACHADEEALRARGASRLWSGRDGEAGAVALAEARDVAPAFGVAPIAQYPALFYALVDGAIVRDVAAHPRLSILGPLEARLQHADDIVLGGLNEGVWPGEPGGDPFLSRPMRAAVGLPSPERRLGLAAHDFANLAAKPNVTLTRARRADGAPAKPSRWLVRLKNLLRGGDEGDAPSPIDRSARVAAIVAALDDAGAARPAKPPSPRPPVAARPRKLFATRIEKWLRDPYAVYARSVLALRELDDPGAAFSKRELGLLLHAVLEATVAKAPSASEIRATLDAELAARASDFGYGPSQDGLWGASVAAAFERFALEEAARRSAGDVVVGLEAKGGVELAGVSPPFTIAGIADRIDRRKDGSLVLYDYKTTLRQTRDQLKAFNPQLQLLAAIAEGGGFRERNGESVPVAMVGEYAYLGLIARDGETSRGAAGDDARREIDEARARLVALVEAYDDPATPYLSQPRPEFTDDYGDYDQLARRGEWAAHGGEA